MARDKQQLGSILILTLLMLLFLQYVAVAVVNSTNISSQIVANFQRAQQLKKTAIKAIDVVINNKDHFANYSKYLNAEGDFSTNLTAITASGFSAKIISFECLDLEPLQSNLDCDLSNEYWQLKVQVEDLASKAKIDLVQGVRLNRLLNSARTGSQHFTVSTLWWYQK
ncbi:MAG: hypothetical protein ACPG57_03440 [Porticoccaceae bacterium]